MRVIAFATLLLLCCQTLGFAESATSWKDAKNTADDIIYEGNILTFYCGCLYQSDKDKDGSGRITDTKDCGYVAPHKHIKRAGRVEWEHVVPVSLMPVRQFSCWTNHNRKYCEKHDPKAQAMMFDLHNLVPAIGQVNALRSNKRYAEIKAEPRNFGACPIQHRKGIFEPGDRQKGDVARIWLYMSDRHGVRISADERAMFLRWHKNDPVSAWEREKNRRVTHVQGNGNPFI